MTTYLNLFAGGGCMFLITISMGFSCVLRNAKDVKYLSAERRNHIESKIQELAQKLGISKSIEFIEKGTRFGALAQGIALFSGRAGIVMNPFLADALSEEELEFIIAHEVAHIRANDTIWLGVVPGIVGVITTLAVTTLFASKSNAVAKFIGSSFIGLSASLITFVYFSRWREECADRLGFSICSQAAREAAPNLFERRRLRNIEVRNYQNGSKNKFYTTATGESRLDVFHPSLESRTRYLRQILKTE